jgi:molybdenum cofactor cytidylyltransferase
VHAQSSVAGLVLAAGGATRFGAVKQLLPLDGRPLLQHVVDAVAAGGAAPVVVVLGHEAAAVEAALALPDGARVVVNPDHARGQSTSLRAGVAALAGDDVDAVLVALGDQPRLRPDAVRTLVEARLGGAGPILQARYGGRPGHPVVLGREVLPEVLGVAGDQGARALMSADPGRVVAVEVGGDPPQDVDTPEDYARLASR